MKNLYMKQKVFSWGDKFMVWDENHDVRYTVAGEVFSWGKKLHVYDAPDVEVAFIWQKVWSWLPRYFVEIGGEKVCAIVRELTLFKPRYRIEGLGWVIQGDFWGHEYQIVDEAGKPVMALSKHWFSWGDSYELRIEDGQDELKCLCVTLAVDAAIEQQNASSSSSSSSS